MPTMVEHLMSALLGSALLVCVDGLTGSVNDRA